MPPPRAVFGISTDTFFALKAWADQQKLGFPLLSDYNKEAIFEFGFYEGKDNYQIYDGTGADKTDSGIPFTDSGVIVTVTITGARRHRCPTYAAWRS